MEDDEVDRFLRKVDGQVLRTFDQMLQELKSFYMSLPEAHRTEFTEWLTAYAQLTQPRWQGLEIALIVDNSCYDPEAEVPYVGKASLKPSIALQAVRAWNDGTEFTPPSGIATI